MSRRSLTLIAGAAVVACIAAGAATAQDRSNWPSALRLGTASQGGTYFIFGSGWLNMVAEELGIAASAEVTGGPVQNATLVQTGDLNLGMVTMGPAYDAWIGESELAPGLPHDQLRAIFPMYTTGFQCIATAASGIKDVAGLNGKTVGVGPAGGTPGTYWPRIFQALDIKVTARQGGAGDQASQVQDGLLDAFCFAAGFPFPAFNELEAQIPVSIFGLTDAEVATVVEKIPAFAPYTIPAGLYRSVEGEQQTVAMWNFAVAHASLPDDLVYLIVKTVMENNERMQQIHPAAVETLPEAYVNNSFLPWHPGAVRWFEENGHPIPDDLKG
jgi:TRAP transporter TAXI family solute receptor